jgi:RND family efflux transporter MFP subunit
VLSPAFLTAQTDFTQAVRRADLLAGTDDEQGARALADAARRRLALLGADSSVIERLRAGEPPLDLIPVSSPFAGSIVEAHTLTGAAVEAGSPIFTLADLSVVNVIAEVPERSLAMLRRGQAARVELAAYPDSPVQGTVERIRERLDPETRTAHAVLRVPNPRGLLRSGMFASVRLQADANGRRGRSAHVRTARRRRGADRRRRSRRAGGAVGRGARRDARSVHAEVRAGQGRVRRPRALRPA